VSNVAFTFGILSLSLAVGSSVSGKLQDRFGVRNVTIASGLLIGAGLFLTAQADSLVMLYVFGGLLVGFADGTGYLMTLSNCVKFFPERKGLVSALSIGAYGLGSLGFKFINMYMLTNTDLTLTFDAWGLIAMVLVIIGGLMMKDAPEQVVSTDLNSAPARDFTLAQAMKSAQFWVLSLIFLTVCMSGLYVIGVAKDVGESYAHLSLMTAASAVAVIAVANLSGRLVLGVLSDKIERMKVISIALIVCLAGVASLLFMSLNMWSFYFAVACIAFSFGGTITVFPSLVSDFFGLNNLTKIYGFIYLGFGIGSIVGSIVASLMGGFVATFYLMLALIIVSTIVSFMIKLPNKSVELVAAH